MKRIEFDALVLRLARAQWPGATVKLEGEALTVTLATGDGLKLSMRTLRASFAHMSDPTQGVTRFLRLEAPATAAAAALPAWEEARARVLPLLKPAGFALGAAERDKYAPHIFAGWYADLCLICVVDSPDYMLHISAGHLADWGLGPELVLAQAQANLGKLGMAAAVLGDATKGRAFVFLPEPGAYVTTMLILPKTREVIAKALGPRFVVWPIAQNIFTAATMKDELFDKQAADYTAERAWQAADRAHLLRPDVLLAFDVPAGTVEVRDMVGRPTHSAS